MSITQVHNIKYQIQKSIATFLSEENEFFLRYPLLYLCFSVVTIQMTICLEPALGVKKRREDTVRTLRIIITTILTDRPEKCSKLPSKVDG